MIQVMHWAVKLQRKQKFLKANSISITVDDRKDYRLVRYRCDVPPEPQVQGPLSLQGWCAQPALASEGLLGVYRMGGNVAENSIASHDADKSLSMAKTIRTLIERACEDPEGGLDHEAHTHVSKNIRHFASDQGGSVAKSGKILSSDGKLPNLCYVSFDIAHQIRIATKDPLHALDGFQAQYDRLFSGKAALLPTIQHSEAWQAKLIACQKEILAKHGAQGAGVQKVLKSLSFAAHRWDSTASPLFKFCCQIRAIALLCGMQAADVPFYVIDVCFFLCLCFVTFPHGVSFHVLVF